MVPSTRYRQLQQAMSEPLLQERQKGLTLTRCGHLKVSEIPIFYPGKMSALLPAVHSPWRHSKLLIGGMDQI